MDFTRYRTYRILRVLMHRKRYTITIPAVMLLLMIFGVCYYEWEYEVIPMPQPRPWSQIVGSDTLRCLTVKTQDNPYPRRSSWRHQSLLEAEAVAVCLGLQVEVVELADEQTLYDELFGGRGDVAIFPTRVATIDTTWHVIPCGRVDMAEGDTTQWMVSFGADSLRCVIDSVCALGDNGQPRYQHVMDSLARVHRRSRRGFRFVRGVASEGVLSPYDELFRQHGERTGFDWRMLAAVAFQETRFNHTLVSAQGAYGLMQVMPVTGRRFGVSKEDLLEADVNIRVGSDLLQSMQNMLRKKLVKLSHQGYSNYDEAPDSLRRRVDHDLLPILLASYNAGLGHIYDALQLADVLGYDPLVWDGNVEYCLRLKADPRFYEMEVCRLGRFNGAFTCKYVHNTLAAYESFRSQIH